MAKSAAQRRAARKRKEQERAHRREQPRSGPASGPSAPLRPDPFEAIRPPGTEQARREAGVHEVLLGVARGADLEAAAARLLLLDPTVDTDGVATRRLVDQVVLQWERGWQPSDLVHVVGREGSPRLVRLAIALIAIEAAEARASERAPEEWLRQLSSVGALRLPSPEAVRIWRHRERLGPLDAWLDVVRLVDLLAGSGRLQQLAPPPSQWGARRTAARQRTGADTRILGRIRGLLAKAESTDFPDEAEALSAKAQELMTRHAIDAAMVEAHGGAPLTDAVRGRRLPIENPYPEARVQLLSVVGQANGVRVVWLQSIGLATMVGLPDDLDAVELLYTSLLVQATRAMTHTGRAGGPRTRSPGFRRGFLIAYAHRIGERLAEVREQATADASGRVGVDLVPVMRARGEAVDEAFAALFPDAQQGGGRSVDAAGWHAGRAAADAADLAGGRDQVAR